jgi:hypothetical protein
VLSAKKITPPSATGTPRNEPYSLKYARVQFTAALTSQKLLNPGSFSS